MVSGEPSKEARPDEDKDIDSKWLEVEMAAAMGLEEAQVLVELDKVSACKTIRLLMTWLLRNARGRIWVVTFIQLRVLCP